MKRGLAIAAAALVVAGSVSACTTTTTTATSPAPHCAAIERVALIAQSVSSASYVPCLATLSAGWRSSGLQVRNGRTTFTLSSDRSPGHGVGVAYGRSCRLGPAVPLTARTPGGRTYVDLTGIDPRYAGTMYDVFPGGCVTYRFDFPRGPHIALMDELESAVEFVPRQQLRLEVARRLGVRLDP